MGSIQPLLQGIRILDLSQVMAGPYCTAMLADLGAEIIKIEMPGTGDTGRFFGPYKGKESTYFMLLNRGKKSVTVNMKSPRGVDLVKELIKTSDVLVENFRPGVTARLGLDYESVQQFNKKIVYASISGYWSSSQTILSYTTGLKRRKSTSNFRDCPPASAGLVWATGIASLWLSMKWYARAN